MENKLACWIELKKQMESDHEHSLEVYRRHGFDAMTLNKIHKQDMEAIDRHISDLSK